MSTFTVSSDHLWDECTSHSFYIEVPEALYEKACKKYGPVYDGDTCYTKQISFRRDTDRKQVCLMKFYYYNWPHDKPVRFEDKFDMYIGRKYIVAQEEQVAREFLVWIKKDLRPKYFRAKNDTKDYLLIR